MKKEIVKALIEQYKHDDFDRVDIEPVSYTHLIQEEIESYEIRGKILLWVVYNHCFDIYIISMFYRKHVRKR